MFYFQSSVPLLEGPKQSTEATESEDNSNSPAIIDAKASSSSAVDLGHFILPADSSLEIVPLLNQDDVKIKSSVEEALLSAITKQNYKTTDGGIPGTTGEDTHSNVHSSANSHSDVNHVNPFRRYMALQSMSNINRNEQVYGDTRDTSFWLVSIVTIILSGVVAFIVTKAANRNGVVQVQINL